jgi:hypothetical protein
MTPLEARSEALRIARLLGGDKDTILAYSEGFAPFFEQEADAAALSRALEAAIAVTPTFVVSEIVAIADEFLDFLTDSEEETA